MGADLPYVAVSTHKLTAVRVNVTWDAIEHAGPGEYDKEFLAYFRALLQSLRGTGIVAYVVSWELPVGKELG